MAHSPLPIPLVVTQRFGLNPQKYAQFGLKGHNGIDLRCPSGTLFVAMLPGVWHLLDDGYWKKTIFGKKWVWTGYGAAWRLDFNEGNGRVKQFTFAHLMNRDKGQNGQNRPAGIAMAHTDNTGFSTGPHLHIGLREFQNGHLLNYTNGFKGAIDPAPFLKSIGLSFTYAY
jgi:murein DD-endopeptidase MepM/ murein hydrolase activator NlpD